MMREGIEEKRSIKDIYIYIYIYRNQKNKKNERNILYFIEEKREKRKRKRRKYASNMRPTTNKILVCHS